MRECSKLSILHEFLHSVYITCELGATAVLISQPRTLRPREVKQLAQAALHIDGRARISSVGAHVQNNVWGLHLH